MANTLTLATIKGYVRNRLGDTAYDSNELTQYANDAQREIVNTKRWRFMERTFNGLVTIGASSYDLPTGFQAAINFTLNSPDSAAEYVEYMPFETFDQNWPDPTALTRARPTVWTFYGNSLILGPASPDQAYTMQLRYLAAPTTLTSDANTLDVPDDFSELMVLGMYRRALMTNDQYDQAQVVQIEWQQQMRAMESRLQSRQYGAPLRTNIGRSGHNKGLTVA